MENYHFLDQQFDLPAPVKKIHPLGSGHIHDTYFIECGDLQTSQFVVQKFNHNIFKDPHAVMGNIELVLDHLHQKLKGSSEMQSLRIVGTRGGALIYQDPQGNFWRVFNYISNSESIDQVENILQAQGAAVAFGKFFQLLSDLNPDHLQETIPFFHHVGRRFEQFKESLEQNLARKDDLCQKEVNFALNREAQVNFLSKLIESDQLPIRVTHNDTKINNVMFRKGSNKGLCVVDLDTVMPGLLMYDFGDMARTFCNSGSEEAMVQGPPFRVEIFHAVCQGFLGQIKNVLSKKEVESLAYGPWLMTYIMGIRFLTDYLSGDVYYKTKYPNHNLDRAKNQFALLSDIEQKDGDIRQIIEQFVTPHHYS